MTIPGDNPGRPSGGRPFGGPRPAARHAGGRPGGARPAGPAGPAGPARGPAMGSGAGAGAGGGGLRIGSGGSLPPPGTRPPVDDGRPTRAELQLRRDVAREWISPRTGSRWRIPGVLAVLAVLVVAGVVVTSRLSGTPAAAVVRSELAGAVTTPGAAPPLPWPAGAEAAVSIPELGMAEQSGVEKPVPVASLTKIMTAYVVLHDHPLPAVSGPHGTGNGPSITMTSADQAEYENDYSQGETSVEVHGGEVLTERQLLDGLLVHSANNLSVTLARWDAGSVPAFVTKMNIAATMLNMSSTHFVDTSGYDPASVSTAADLLKVTAAAMAEPAFPQAVTMTSVSLPVAGVVPSYTPLLGTDGVVGVKSGFMSAAGGCDVLADVRLVHGQAITLLAAVVGVQGYLSLNHAGDDGLTLAKAAAADVVTVPVLNAGQEVAVVSANGHHVPVVATRSVSFLAWPGTVVTRALNWRKVEPGAAAGTAVGTVRVSLGQQSAVATAGMSRRLPPPTLVERLF